MNHPFQPYFPQDFRDSLQKFEKSRLRKDATYIGVLSIILTIVMEVAFTVLVVFLMQIGVFTYEQLSDPFLGLDNTSYLWLYCGVYTFSLLVPSVVVSLCFKRRFIPFAPAKPLPFAVAFLSILSAVGLCMFSNIINSYVLTFFSEMGLTVPDAPQTMVNTPTSFAMNLFMLTVLPALLEEMIYRGYILRILRPYGNWFAIVISSLLFSLMHGNLRQIPFAFIVGLVLGVLYVVSENIWIPIAVHFTNNAISVVMEYLGFSITANQTGMFYTLVLHGLVFVGAAAAILLFTRYRKHIVVPKVNTSLSASQRTQTLFTAPLFLLSIVLYLMLLFGEV